MADEVVVDRIADNGDDAFAGKKMKEKHKNGIIHERNINMATCLEKNWQANGHGCLSRKLNGFHHKLKSGKVRPAREGIRAPSLRASPVRNIGMSVPNLDSSRSSLTDESRSNKNNIKADGLPCMWMDCGFTAGDVPQLASHAQEQHVDPMKTSEVFMCLWQDCKVFNRPSCSMSWLTKHLESHIGIKPFKCIFEGCSMSFSTQTGLARHVPCHFQENARQSKKNFNNNSGKEESPSKKQLKRKRLKYIRYKKAGTHGKMEDFLDQHAVDSIKSRLESMIGRDEDPVGIDGAVIHFMGELRGRRVNIKGEREVLLHWIPESILPDEWILDDGTKRSSWKRSLPIRSLPNDVKSELHSSFYRRLSHRKKRRK